MKPELVHEKNKQSWQLFHQVKKSFPFLWHYHDECELFVPIEGQWKYLIGNLQGDIEPGQAFFLPPRTTHSFFTVSDNRKVRCSCYVLFLSLPLTSANELTGYDLTSVLNQQFAGGAQLTKIIKLRTSLEDMAAQQNGLTEAAAFLNTLDVLLQLPHVRRLAQSPIVHATIPHHSEAVTQIGEYLSRHWQKPLTLETIAEATHMTVPTMCRIFRRSTGRSIFEYLRELRISHVQRQLAWSNLAISNIALDSGFQTLGHFYRSFREATGLSPASYRKSIRKNMPEND
jgi:AraC-like DNA-binding protein